MSQAGTQTDLLALTSDRIQRLQKLCLLVSGINLAGVALALLGMFLLGISLEKRTGADLYAEIAEQYSSFAALNTSTTSAMVQVKELEMRVDWEESERRILETAETLFKTEEDFQLFLRLLKVYSYNLTDRIPNTISWYDRYGPDLDALIERSRARQLTLLRINEFYLTPGVPTRDEAA